MHVLVVRCLPTLAILQSRFVEEPTNGTRVTESTGVERCCTKRHEVRRREERLKNVEN